jgi:Uma2 family endonuclease
MSIAEPPRRVEDREPTGSASDEALFEIIDGRRVELTVSALNNQLASRFLIYLGSIVLARGLGQVVSENLFELPLRDRSRSRRPDVAYVSFDRWPESRPMPETGEEWPVVPDLAVEFISPHDESVENMAKLKDYFEAGVRQVWLVYPLSRTVFVHDSVHVVRGLIEPSEIDGGDILPGIRVPVAAMLPPRP